MGNTYIFGLFKKRPKIYGVLSRDVDRIDPLPSAPLLPLSLILPLPLALALSLPLALSGILLFFLLFLEIPFVLGEGTEEGNSK
jgi:hypothetical protein